LKNFLKNNITLLVALLLAVLAGSMVYITLSRQSPSVPVVVAAKNLPIGTVIEKDDITVKMLPPVAVPDSSYRSADKVIGMTVTAGPIVRGDIVRAPHLAVYGSLHSTLQTLAPAGWVAVELPEEAGKGMTGIHRGDKVNICTEVPFGEGTVVDRLVEGAIVISVPDAEKNTANFIVAVPPEYEVPVAELIVRNKPVTITLPDSKEGV